LDSVKSTWAQKLEVARMEYKEKKEKYQTVMIPQPSGEQIEVDPKEEASLVEVFQDVLDKLYDVGKKDQLLKFFKLVQDGKFLLKCHFHFLGHT
jgi:hypothetical protein